MLITLTPEQKFLCCAVSDDAMWHQEELKILWEKIGDESAFEVAQKNGCASIVAVALKKNFSEETLASHWQIAADEISQKLALYMFELDRMANALAEQSIPLIALKNSGIARGIYTDLAGCPMGDIDVLVDNKDFEQAHEILLSLGYQLASRSPLGEKNFEEMRRSGGTEYTYTLSDDHILWIELQWRAIAGRWINENQEPPSDILVVQSVSITDSKVRLLAPCDNLLQVSLHTAKHSYVRAPGFRLHTDVDRIVRHCEIDWDVFIQKVKHLRVCTAVYFSLFLAKELLWTPIADEILAELRPNTWRRFLIWRLLLKAGLFNPDDKKWGRIEYILFNSLLYDKFSDLLRSLFPSSNHMKKIYPFKYGWLLPFLHARRILELLFKRANT